MMGWGWGTAKGLRGWRVVGGGGGVEGDGGTSKATAPEGVIRSRRVLLYVFSSTAKSDVAAFHFLTMSLHESRAAKNL